MIKLTELTPAGKKAKELGLKHVGFGRYVNPQEPDRIVAKSVNKQLVMLRHSAPRERIPARRVKSKDKPKASDPTQLALPGLEKSKTRSVKKVEKWSIDNYTDLNDPFGYIREEVVPGEQTIIYASNTPMPQRRLDKTSPEYQRSYNMFMGLTGRLFQLKWSPHSDNINREYANKLERKDQKNKDLCEEDASHQTNYWRLTLTDLDQEELADVQRVWQQDSSWTQGSKSRMNRTINKFATGGQQTPTRFIPKPKVKLPWLERGMTLHLTDAAEFLKTFKVGSSIILPPSGFSAQMKQAREYSIPSSLPSQNFPDQFNRQVDILASETGSRMDSTVDALEDYDVDTFRTIGVILKVKPAAGTKELTGIHLSGIGEAYNDKIEDLRETEPEEPLVSDVRDEVEERWPPPPDPKDFEMYDDYEEAMHQREDDIEEETSDEYHERMDQYYENLREWEFKNAEMIEIFEGLDEYDSEQEIIIPGTVSHKVTKVKKHVFPRSDVYDEKLRGADIIYQIELEQEGEVDPELFVEQEIEERLGEKNIAVMKKYLNNTVGQDRVND